MLSLFGNPHARGGFCDGVTRRDFLTVGGTLFGGALALPHLLAADAKTGNEVAHKSVINVYLPGGPPHQDMWDLKPDAPVEVRGEFKPIQTNVPGIQICELFPRIAKMMDKFAIIRSLVGSAGDHDAFQCMTGRPRTPANLGFWPSFGSWVSKAQGQADAAVPANVSLVYPCGEKRWGYPGDGGFLGIQHAPFHLVGGQRHRHEGRQPDAQGRHPRPAHGSRQPAERVRRPEPQARRKGHDGRDGHVQPPGARHPHVVEAEGRHRPDERRPEDAGAVRRGRPGVRARRCAAHGAELLRRAATGRSRRARGDDELHALGLARAGRQELRPGAEGLPAARSGHHGAGRRPARPRAGATT